MAFDENKVLEIISTELSVAIEKVTADASFVSELGADSLDTVELIMALEEEFGIEISDDEAQKIGTVQDAIDHIKNNL